MKFIDANVTLMVADLDAALAFYTKVLGFRAGARHGGFFAEARAPGVTVVLHPKRKDTKVSAGHVSIGMRVDSISETAANLRKVGVPFEQQENDANQFLFLKDLDGTALYFMHEKRRD